MASKVGSSGAGKTTLMDVLVGRKTGGYIELGSLSGSLPVRVCLKKLAKIKEKVMRLVELDTMRNALVGLPGSSGLSTEQRKRLTIAVELVANPSIIFMDDLHLDLMHEQQQL
ncbi:hypothetical protein JRO89_XS07G0273100 [Xanthoceras sorbifolium]|uniref:ABC transporter domain-containing protein n=1 Tax=Xanthoceras sorbifolium TaxID=99658 RepID=A0ABQ8HVK7_9ROSI|nr:hypothetical protein JRO89_XS07G0273100 [Xanthoceras sorbifolium]